MNKTPEHFNLIFTGLIGLNNEQRISLWKYKKELRHLYKKLVQFKLVSSQKG